MRGERRQIDLQEQMARTMAKNVEMYAEDAHIPDLEREWAGAADFQMLKDDARAEQRLRERLTTQELAALRLLAERFPKEIHPEAKGVIMPLFDALKGDPRGLSVVIGTPDGATFAVRANVAEQPINIHERITKHAQEYAHLMHLPYFIDPKTQEHSIGHAVPHTEVSFIEKDIQDAATNIRYEEEGPEPLPAGLRTKLFEHTLAGLKAQHSLEHSQESLRALEALQAASQEVAAEEVQMT